MTVEIIVPKMSLFAALRDQQGEYLFIWVWFTENILFVGKIVTGLKHWFRGQSTPHACFCCSKRIAVL